MYLNSLKISDKVLFFNSVEILLEGDIFNRTHSIENGKVTIIDSINNIFKIVPELTPGGLINMKKSSNGEIQMMVISFSQNETTYQFGFFKRTDGSFLLSGDAKILYLGKEYKVTAQTKGECILLFNFEKKEVKSEIKESAEGWRIER